MLTPTHAILGVALFGAKDAKKKNIAAIVGGLLPDIVMFGFYAYQKVIGTPEKAIWGEKYFQTDWQLFFDAFNSIPIFTVGMLIAWQKKSKTAFALFGAALLHCLCDLPVHHDDGHGHFFPFTTWKYQSPVSYWDPAHHGVLASCLECGLVICVCAYLFRRHTPLVAKGGVAFIALVYLLFGIGRIVIG